MIPRKYVKVFVNTNSLIIPSDGMMKVIVTNENLKISQNKFFRTQILY